MPNSPTNQSPAGNQAAAVTQSNWLTFSFDDPFPSGANVVLGFTGLMCFCHRSNHPDKNCEIGIHNRSSNHNLKITVYQLPPTPIFDPPDPAKMDMGQIIRNAGPFDIRHTGNSMTDIVRFTVNSPRETGVLYFQKDGQQGRPHDDPRNFRNILDFESDDFYGPVELPKHFDHMGPRILVEHARLYTLCASASTFKRVDADTQANPHQVQHIARMVGANIYLNGGGYVQMYIESLPQPVVMKEPGKFFVLIDNSCPAAQCKTSDFPHYRRDIFDPPPSNPVDFDLALDVGGSPNPSSGSPCAKFVHDKIRTPPDFLVNDETPCAPGGFGSSGGMP